MTFNENSAESWEGLGPTQEIKELKKAIENGVELGDTFFSDMSPFTLNKKILNTYNAIKGKIKRTNIKICSKNDTTMEENDTIIHKIKNIIPSYNGQGFHTQKIENNDYIYFDPKKFIDAFGNVPLENILTILPINSKILFLVVGYLLASYDEAIKKNENKGSFDKYKTFFDQYFSSYQSNKTTSTQEKFWNLGQYGNEIVEKTQKGELEEMKREIVKLMKHIDTTPTYTQKIQQLVQKEIDTYTISQQNNYAVEDNFDVIKMQLLSLKERLSFLSKQLKGFNRMKGYSAKYDRKNKMYQSEIITTQENINESIKTTIENCQTITEINFEPIINVITAFDGFVKNEKIIFLSAGGYGNTDNSSTRRAFLDEQTRSIVDKAQGISNFEFQDFEIGNKTLEQGQKNNLQIEIVPPLSEDMHLRGAVMVTNQGHITKSTSQTTNPNENDLTDEKKNTNATIYTMKITKNGFYKGEVLPLPLGANIQSIKINEENAGNPLRNLQNEYPSQGDKESGINYNYDSQTGLYRIEDNENNFDQNMEIQFVIDENANINVPTAEDTYFFDHNIPLIQRNNSTVDINKDGTTAQKVATIQHYINDNSYYGFNDNILLPEYEKDPTTYIQDLIAFYQQGLPGYDGKIQIVCNQSALIAMIMLQQQNIPARMIVGQHYEDPNGPGHAWVEYWDKEEKKRKSMDPTPDYSTPEGIGDTYIPSSWIQDTYINLVERKKYPTGIEILQQTTGYDTTLQKYPRLLQYDPAIEANVVQTDDTRQLYRKGKNEKDEATFENCTIILTQLISYIKGLKKIAGFINNPSLTQIVDIHELFGQLQSFENDKSYIIGEAEAKVKEKQLDTVFLDILSKNVLNLNTSQYDLYQQLSQKNGQEIPEKTQEISTEQLFQTLSVEKELEIYTLPGLQDSINQKITEQHGTINKIINNDGIHYTIKTDKADIILRKFNDQRQTKDNKTYKPKEYINRGGETLVTNDANDATFSLHDVGNALLKPLGISKIQIQETNSKVYLKENTSEGKESEGKKYDLRIIADYGLEYAVDYIKLLGGGYISDINTKKITVLLIGYQMKNDETNDNPYVFHKDIYQYTNLKTLQIENISPEKKGIDHIAGDISQLAQLEALILGHNNIETLPTEIGALKKLKELHMAGNILKSLPTQIGNLTRLEVLDVSANQITKLPPEIGLCTGLKELKFGYNQLTQLPSEIIKSCTGLEILTINNNQFTSLPIEIRNLANLKVLDISNNQLTQLPSEIIKLQNLETLIITNNPGLKGSFTVKQSTTVIGAKYDGRTKKNNNDGTATYTK